MPSNASEENQKNLKKTADIENTETENTESQDFLQLKKEGAIATAVGDVANTIGQAIVKSGGGEADINCFKELADKYVSKENLDKIAKLDRSKIVFDYMAPRIQNVLISTPVFSSVLGIMNTLTNKSDTGVNFINVISLPTIQMLVQELDKKDPQYINDAANWK